MELLCQFTGPEISCQSSKALDPPNTPLSTRILAVGLS